MNYFDINNRTIPNPIEPIIANTNFNQINNNDSFNNYINDNLINNLNNNDFNNNYFNDFLNNSNISNDNNNNKFINNNININQNQILTAPFIPYENFNQNQKKKMVKKNTSPNLNFNPIIEPIPVIEIQKPKINQNNQMANANAINIAQFQCQAIPNVQNQTMPCSFTQCKKIFGNIKPIDNYVEEGKVILKNNQIPNNELKNHVILLKKYKINIIYYDENLTNIENNRYCSYFKLILEGAFYGINDFNLFKYICHKIQQNSRNFILISSGSSAKKIYDYCENKNISNIKIYLIFCEYIQKYQNLKQDYFNLKGIFNDFNELIKFIFSNNALIPTGIRIKASNFIFLEDDNSTYIKLHFEIVRKYSLYKLFKSQNFNKSKFMELIKNKNRYYKSLARELLYNDDESLIQYFKVHSKEPEAKLRQVFNGKHNIQNYISNYTFESFYYKYINKALREGDFNIFRLLSNHISKFIYHLYEYKKTHFQNNNSTLYRSMYISQAEYNTYRNSIGKIICYPSFTSTSLHRGWTPIPDEPNLILVRLEIQQNYSQSIINIMNLSNHKYEEEYLCLPFTFFKITNVVCKMDNNIQTITIYLTALNSEKPIEDMFIDFLENETDNLDPEGLEMIRLVNDTTIVLNPYIKKEYYKKYLFHF